MRILITVFFLFPALLIAQKEIYIPNEWQQPNGLDYSFGQLTGTAGEGAPDLHEDVGHEVCPKDGQPMVLKKGRYGPFLACSCYPVCRTTRRLVRGEGGKLQLEVEKPIDEKCPECGHALAWRRGRFGAFVACSRYPECKYIKKKEAREIGLACPECGQGQFSAERGGLVLVIEDGIDFHQVERGEFAGVGNQLHHHVRLAVVEAALDWRAHARGNRGIADVEIKRHMQAPRTVGRDLQRAFHHRRDAVTVDVLHGEDVPVAAVALFFAVVEGGLWVAGVRTLAEETDPSLGFAGAARVYERDEARGVWVTPQRAVKHSFNYQEFRLEKPGNGLRVFTLGGSSAWGFPWGARVAFPSALGRALQATYAERAVESVKAAAMSYGSVRLARLTHEILTYRPDLLIVFEGHNEFVEKGLERRVAQAPRPAAGFAPLLRSRLYSVMARACMVRAFATSTRG